MIQRTLRSSFFLFFILLLLIACLPENDLQAMPPVQRTVLPNKLVVLHSEDHSLPFITIELLIDGGSRRDPPGEEGLSHLTAKGLLLGTSKHTVSAINEELDFMGASISSSSGRDYSALSMRVLKKDLDKALTLFMEELTQPAFPDDEIKREIEKTLAAIQAEEDQPGTVAEKAFQKALFLSSPYGHPVIGTKESLPKITREAISHFYETYYHPNNCILVVVGDITSEELKTKLSPLFEKMPSGKIPEVPFTLSFAKGPETIKIDREITQANIILGNEGISRDNPDFYAVSVMNYILGGGGFASRLLEEIRNKRGLAYSVASFFDTGKYPGSFQIVLQTKNPSAREAVSLAVQQMELIRKEPVSDKELDGARKYLIGSFPMRLDTQTKLANFLAQVEYYGLGLDYPEKYPSLIQSVTKEDVLKVAKKYLHPENYVLVVVANLKDAGMTAASSTADPESPNSRTSGADLSASEMTGQRMAAKRGVTQADLGISVEDISPRRQKEFHIDDQSGVVVISVRPDSPADAAGMQEGDVIKEIDRKPISNVKDFESFQEQWERERNIEFTIKRGIQKLYIVIGTDRNDI